MADNFKQKRIYRVGTRRSPLALKQVEEVIAALKSFYPESGYEIMGIDTYGDKDKRTPISDIEGTDFFTREIDEALLRATIDFVVHSAKDLPEVMDFRLTVAAITKSRDQDDALVAKGNLRIDQLPSGARVGVSSRRRKTQLTRYRADLEPVDIRGDIIERLKRLDSDNLDAIVVAACALVRLGLEYRITQRLPHCILRPHPLQGALAIVTRSQDKELLDLLKVLNVPKKEF
jgi:hydroxymethylbilane synthase